MTILPCDSLRYAAIIGSQEYFMDRKEFIEHARILSNPFRITNGQGFHLNDINPFETLHFTLEDKPREVEALSRGVELLEQFQNLLYAQDRWALLLIFQAMDAAGKDGTIKHVMSGVNPQGCQVTSFSAPSAEDLDHDFLWRCNKALPERGRIGIFNRSYYEETLIVRVHHELLARETLPRKLVSDDIWENRFCDIRHHEQYLFNNGIIVLKFFLHLSKKEQKKRFLERLNNPEKNWKFSASDIQERAYWDDYMEAYEETIQHTASEHAPWYVVPADNKWFTRIVVAATIIKTLDSLDLSYPRVSEAEQVRLREAKSLLENE